jgi:hypothetical protein
MLGQTLVVIPSEARNLLFAGSCNTLGKQQVPRRKKRGSE